MRRTEPKDFINSAGSVVESDDEPPRSEIAPAQRPALTVDVARYAAMLDDPALSASERAEFIEALWEILVCFIDLGFHIHPLQQIETPANADADRQTKILAMTPAEMVKLDGLFPRQQFARAARRPHDLREEDDS